MIAQEAVRLLNSIEGAFEKKDTKAALEFYHDNIVFINPAFPAPVVGKVDLKSAFERNFAGPQRTRMTFSDVHIRDLVEGAFIIDCRVEGIQTLYVSGRRFKGYLSRVFVDVGGKPLIVHEHFSLVT